jgi:hypothetical protein
MRSLKIIGLVRIKGEKKKSICERGQLFRSSNNIGMALLQLFSTVFRMFEPHRGLKAMFR